MRDFLKFLRIFWVIFRRILIFEKKMGVEGLPILSIVNIFPRLWVVFDGKF
jgi:hypothetical protein